MNDQQALLLAAIANPEEDTPRLALADWLEEHGDEHERARAEFIRLQCQIARIVEPALSHLIIQLRTRADELRDTHMRPWLGPLWHFTGDGYQDRYFDRGLLYWWYTPASAFLGKSHQAAVCEQFPSSGVGAMMLTARSKRSPAVAESTALGWVSRFCWRRSQLNDKGFHAIAMSPHTSRVSTLEIEQPKFGNESLVVLANSTCWPNLRRFGLTGGAWNGRYMHHGVLSVLNSDRFPHLSELDLSDGQPSGFEQWTLYQDAGLQRLRVLWRGAETSMRRFTACPHFTNLEEFRLWNGQVTDADAGSLLDNPAFARLRKLTLQNANPRTQPLSAAVEQKLRDRFGEGLTLDYSTQCLRS